MKGPGEILGLFCWGRPVKEGWGFSRDCGRSQGPIERYIRDSNRGGAQFGLFLDVLKDAPDKPVVFFERPRIEFLP